MARSRIVRLSLAYLAIIMAISIFFSFIIYSVTVGEAKRGLESQIKSLRQNLYFIRPDALEISKQDQLESYRHRVILKLMLINAGMLGLGSGLSYFLAKRNLEPLETSLAAQARFSSDAAHELRTPLTAMKTEIEVELMNKKLSTSEAKILLKSNLEEINRLTGLTDSLLRLARDQNDTTSDIFSAVNIKQVTETAVKRLEAKANQKNIQFKIDSAPALVNGDRDQLIELMVILIDNAIKYSPDKTTVKIISQNSAHNMVQVSVKDQGIGIKTKDLPHIYERFYRADQSRSKQNAAGFGLGLSLAKQIVESHGGKIWCQSVAGKGTTFIFNLPVLSAHPTTANL